MTIFPDHNGNIVATFAPCDLVYGQNSKEHLRISANGVVTFSDQSEAVQALAEIATQTIRPLLTRPDPVVTWIDNPGMRYTTAMLGACMVGRVFYGEGKSGQRARWFRVLDANGRRPAIEANAKSRSEAEANVIEAVDSWLRLAGLKGGAA